MSARQHAFDRSYESGLTRGHVQAERLSSLQVRYGWRLDAFTQYSNGVLSQISPTESNGIPPPGQQEVRSKYIVGADGPVCLQRERHCVSASFANSFYSR